MRLAIFFSLLFFFSLASVSLAWWDPGWHYRIAVNVSYAGSVENATARTNINFSSLINGTFDPNSIRVVEAESLPYDFENETFDKGNVTWIANGTITSVNRTFYIYFDITENGNKASVSRISEYPYWRSGYTNNMDVTSPAWNRTWAKLITVSWKGCSEAGYDVAYLLNGSSLYPSTGKSGAPPGWSETVNLTGNSTYSRFTSDGSNIQSCSDAYGTYGAAVDWIKFYPVAKYTTPSLTINQGSAETQYMPNLTNAVVTPSTGGWGETFTYFVNVSDNENDQTNVTLWVNISGLWTRNSTKNINPPGRLNWSLSFSCSDYGTAYKFEYNDAYHNSSNTSIYSGPAIESDDLALEYLTGNNTQVNRSSGNVTIGIRLRDLDKNIYVSGFNVSFLVYYSGVWNIVGNATASDGNATYAYDPGCSVSAGLTSWKANYSSSCYKSNESGVFSFSTLGQLQNYLSAPSTGSVYERGDTIQLIGNATDECSNLVSSAVVNFTLINNYTYTAGGDNGVYNYTWSSMGKPSMNYTVQMNSSKQYYNFNSTIWPNVFFLDTGPPVITIISVNQTEQLNSVVINASILDQGESGIAWVRINITQPNGTVYNNSMAQVNSTLWSINYPGSWGTTTERGIYRIIIYAKDNYNKTGSSTHSLSVYAKLNVTLRTQSSEYYQGSYGSVYYKVTDALVNLSGVNVNISIADPNNTKLYLLTGSSYTTDPNGAITAVFIIPSDSPAGNYTISAISSYNDTNTNITAANTSTYVFRVIKENALSAKLVIPSNQYIGYDLSVSALVYDAQNPSFGIDPDEITIMFYRTSEQFGLSYWFNVTKSQMTRNSQGFYSYSRNITSSILEGNYLAILSTAYNSLQKSDITAFRIVSAGPFDVSIRALKSVVSPGEDLTFEINITNAGATDDFDANVTYWIDDGSRYRSSSSVRVFAGTTTILGKTFTILPDEQGGVHTIRVSVAYPSITSPATAETTFTVTGAVTTTTAPGAGGAGGGITPTTVPRVITKIEFIDYPAEIEVERGWMKYSNIKINNTGSTLLNNIKLSVDGVPSDWLEITPEQIKYLMSGSSETFSLRVAVPVTAKPGNYPVNITVTSEASASVSSIIRVFSSKADLILFNLETIRSRLKEIENATLQAEKTGKNVTAIINIIYEVKDRISIAEKYTDMNDYDTALEMIRAIKDLLDKAGLELERSQIIVSRPLEINYLVLIIITAVILIIVVYWLNKRMGLFEKSMKQYIFETKKMVVGRKTTEELQKEQEKIEKMLKILKKEYDEGVISKSSYEELKNKNEKRLSEIEKKIGVKA